MKLTDDFIQYLYKYWILNSEDVCKYCKYNIECKQEDCLKYEDFGPCVLKTPDGKSVQSSYNCTCMDLDFGTCNLLKETPCNDCVSKDLSNFIWNGNVPDNYSHW